MRLGRAMQYDIFQVFLQLERMHMKFNKTLAWTLILMILVTALYRILPGRQPGFAPQWAVALFAGATIKDRRWAILLPVFSMLISDILYQLLHISGLTAIPGFYQGQWINYLLFASVTGFGFFIKRITIQNVLLYSVIAPFYFFVVSNFLTWAGVGEYVEYPKTWSGLIACYTAAIPFFKWSVIATVLFSGILFGTYYLVRKSRTKAIVA